MGIFKEIRYMSTVFSALMLFCPFLVCRTRCFCSAAGKTQTMTGQVSDAMCGAKHQMGTPADCARSCVKHGSKYALVVGDKVARPRNLGQGRAR